MYIGVWLQDLNRGEKLREIKNVTFSRVEGLM
jgi:hypothetical protein